MADPLVIQFAADTSRAQSAMATLAGQIVGNMTSIGVAMSGGAANANGFGGALSGLASNAQRAAAAVGADVTNIARATAAAATSEKATLEGIVRSFTAAAAGSQTAQAAVKSGLTGSTTAITTIAAQIPSLGTLLGAFLAFEAAKLVFDSVAASIEEARKHVEEFVKIGKDAERAGVGSDFFQRATLGAEQYGLKIDQVTAALNAARAASEGHIGEGEHGSNTSSFDNRLTQNVRAGNLTAADKATFDGAATQEAKILSVLALIDKLRSESRDLAAFDLAGKFFGPDFERQLRNGVDLTTKLRDTVNSTAAVAGGQRIVGDDEIRRANELDAKIKEISDTFATALAPIQRDISNSSADIYQHFLEFELSVARAAIVASNLYVEIVKVGDAIANAIPSAGQLATTLGAIDLGKALGINGIGAKAAEVLDNFKRAVGLKESLSAPEVQGPPAPLDLKVRPKGPDRSAVLPSLRPKAGGSDAESLDAVETLIGQIEKARDTSKAELENVAKTNVEREKAVALAKAEAAAREDVKRGKRTDPALDDDERARVLAAAEAMQKYRDATLDAQQALRQSADAARYFGDAAASSLSDAILEGKSFSTILDGLIKQLARAALQAAFTGQGPLAGLLGTAPLASAGPNAVGGLAGLFSGAFGGASAGGLGAINGVPVQGPSLPGGGFLETIGSLFRANGGPVIAGTPYTIGERGRELFVPDQNGQVVPIGSGASSGGGTPVFNFIDQRPAGAPEQEQTARRNSSGGFDVATRYLESGLVGRGVGGRGRLAPLLNTAGSRAG